MRPALGRQPRAQAHRCLSTIFGAAWRINQTMSASVVTFTEMPAEAPLSPCGACGVMGRWASVKGGGRPVNLLVEATPHPLGMYALLRDGRRAVNLVWACQVEPGGQWLDWPGQRHRDHFTVCAGWPGLRTSTDIVRSAIETIGEPDRGRVPRDRPRPSRRLCDWP